MSLAEELDALSPEILRQRLIEAEETLRAIRDGEADALVVRSNERDQVFALAGGEESYRALMEAMDIGALALDGDGRVLYANAAFCTLVGAEASALQRDGFDLHLDGPVALELKTGAIAAREAHFQTQFVLPSGAENRHVVLSAGPLPLAFGQGSILTLTDVTAGVEAAAAEESERIGRAVMASANEPVIVCDHAGMITNANAAVTSLLNADPVGRTFEEAFPLEFPIGSGIMHVDDLLAVAIEGNAVRGIEASAPFADPPKDLLVSAAPLRLPGRAVGGCVITLIDLTERKVAEKRQALLMRELDHRVKNAITMVLSICSRTISSSADLSDFRDRFTKRLQALAATHNLLADSKWRGLDLAALVQGELSPYVSASGPRLVTQGLDRKISTDIAVALGLVIHELATNAVKYGALSCDLGSVSVIARDLPDNRFEIVWRESGGPEIKTPITPGFGQTLIARSLKRGHGTGAEVKFAPDGLVCRIVLPS